MVPAAENFLLRIDSFIPVAAPMSAFFCYHKKRPTNQEMHIEKINGLFFEIDQARTGTITFEMFKKKMDSPEVRTFFETIELDVWDAWAFFKLLDLDGGRGDDGNG